MKGKEYVLELLNNSFEDYVTAADDVEKLVAVVQLNLLKDLLDISEIPLHMQLKMHQIAFEVMLKEFEEFQVIFV